MRGVTRWGWVLIIAGACRPNATLLPPGDAATVDALDGAVVDLGGDAGADDRMEASDIVLVADHPDPVDRTVPDAAPQVDASVVDVIVVVDAVTIDVPASSDRPPVEVPSTCAMVRRANPGAADGEYVLYLGGETSRPWRAWCRDMVGTPTEYLTFATTGGGANYSQCTGGGFRPGMNVRTTYQRVRIDPNTLFVHIGDQTFATSTGRLEAGTAPTVTSMPYAVAMDCLDGRMRTGVANVDLRGTPFAVAADAFVTTGNSAGGAATYAARNQVVDLVGGGACGWIAPRSAPYDPVNTTGGFNLPLTYVGSAP